jgi:FlaA1/EpsC-like NDP-sugar epimerase
MGRGGDVFVLDMGEPVKIVELAERLIKLSGMEVKSGTNPEGDIEIIFTGLRPGEKLYEELLIGDNVSTTKHQQIWKAKEDFLAEHELQACIHKMKEAEKNNDIEALKKVFSEAIHGYQSNAGIVDIISIKNQEILEE